MKEIRVLNACLTGMVATKEKNAHLPITPAEIVRDAVAVAAEGASIVHVHARDAEGQPTWDPEVYREIIIRIRAERPDLVICVSTSGRLWANRAFRSAVLRLEGAAKPDMASLTLGTVRFLSGASVNTYEDISYLAACMKDHGIRPEFEVFDETMPETAMRLVRENMVSPPFYFNIILGNHFSAPATREALESILQRLPSDCTWAVGGIARSQFVALRFGCEVGGGMRVGLEDNLYLNHDTKQPATNVELVKRAVGIMRECGTRPASPAETRRLIGLTS